MNRYPCSRRAYLVTTGAVSIGGLTGCLSDESGGDQPSAGDLVEQWSADINGYVETEPVVADGTVYIGKAENETSETTLYALDAEDGTERWTFDGADHIAGSPTLVGNSIYASVWKEGVYVLNAEDGTVRRKFAEELGYSPSSPPAVTDDTIYVTRNNTSSTANQMSLYAIDRTDGSIRWRVQMRGGVTESPTIIEDSIYVTSTVGGVHALDTSDGSELWRASTGATGMLTAPVVIDGTVYVGGSGGNDGKFAAFRTDDGENLWDYDTDAYVGAKPVVASGTVYAGVEEPSRVFALNGDDGSELWSYNPDGQILTPAAPAGDLVYVGGETVHALDRESGTLQLQFNGEIDGFLYLSSVANGTLYAVTGEGSVYALTEE